MGFLDIINETIRRAKRAGTGWPDDWYVAPGEYVLEITAPIGAPNVSTGQAYMVLPLGVEAYRVQRRMRKSLTPTLGGVVVEEHGSLWKEIHVSGSFGLEPKSSPDTSLLPESPLAGVALSGPGWTRRMMRNYFDVYGELKANPQFAAGTTLIWHDLKTGDSWVVVPDNIVLDRTVARRSQYPWSFDLVAVADADAIVIPPSPASLLDKISNAIAEVNSALALVNSAVQEGSATLGEVRYFAATIDSALDKLTTIANSATDFVNGITETLSVGADFISSTTELLEATLGLLETAQEMPAAVRANYQAAVDGLDAMRAQVSAFGQTYDAAAAPITAAERGAAGESRASLETARTAGPPGTVQAMASSRVRSTDLDRVDAGATGRPRLIGTYTGTRTIVLTAADSLPSLASRYLGDGSLWYDIAIINGLRSPYISPTRVPGTVAVGDQIAIPTTTPNGSGAVLKTEEGQPGLDRMGTDFLYAINEDIPGRPRVDFQIDQRDLHDFQLVSGIPNLAQALQLRLWTERGHMPLLPRYGLPRVIGLKSLTGQLAVLRVALRSTLLDDPRVASIVGLRAETDADALAFDVDVVPIGYDTPQPLRVTVA